MDMDIADYITEKNEKNDNNENNEKNEKNDNNENNENELIFSILKKCNITCNSIDELNGIIIERSILLNTELYKQFVSEIYKADIIIADLTHNNPNVHVELGIALQMNKNMASSYTKM